MATAWLRESPQFAALRLPYYRRKTPAMVVTAHGLADAATPYTEVFVEEKLPADLMEELRSVGERLKRSAVRRLGPNDSPERYVV